MPNNAAFIDSNNLYKAMAGLKWKLDNGRFRKFLLDKYEVQKAYLCIGYLPQNQAMYTKLQQTKRIHSGFQAGVDFERWHNKR